MKPQDFIKLVAEGAQEFQVRTGVFASVTIAQAALETGWGQFIPVDKYTGKPSHNLFGVKGVGPAGSVTCQTWEVVNGKKVVVDAQFRAYNSIAESIADHGAVLLLPRYRPVREAKTSEEAAMLLHPCGYATDPDYGKKLVNIMRTYNLQQYDLTKEEVEVLKDVAQRILALEEKLKRFEDQQVSSWAKESVEKAKSKKIMTGDPDGTWDPKRPVDREMLAVVLDRLGLLD